MESGAHLREPFLERFPAGQLPALSHGPDLNVFESGAVLLYLAELAGELRDARGRADAASWVLFANSTMGNALYIPHMRERGMPKVMGALERALQSRPHLAQSGDFGVADVAVGSLLLYLPMMFPDLDVSGWPGVVEY
eukprot:CAMPEP_0183808196 /NCGR_PEP_ID=MMETSP0803_2-20130417/43082_1 /TAXON_ID=195967 /ORGANISM="Crustomastix stigmata, Strain CCMP3273" /LENGTH=137 /DNA_ID=CAMNT_0026052983 /DNA_START=12 /DNA_END=422 /DNA_ORIENTATION=+